MAVHAEAFDAQKQQERAFQQMSPSARIAATNAHFLRSYRANAGLLASLEQIASSNAEFAEMRKVNRDAYISRSARAIRRWQKQGTVVADLDAECTAHALGSMVERYAYMAFVFGEGCTDEDRAVAALNRVWFGALGWPPEPGADRNSDDAEPTRSTPRAARAGRRNKA